MTEYWNEFKIVFGGDYFDQLLLILMTIHLISMTTHQNQLQFDQFASDFDDHSSDFDDHSWKSVAI